MGNNKLRNQIDWVATIVPLVGVVALCIVFMLMPEKSSAVLGMIRGFLGDTCGLYYALLGVGILGCTLFMAFTKYGNIKLGDVEKPQYSSFTWGTMIFTSTMAADIMFYSLCEWSMYANEPQIEQMGGIQKWASTYPLFHWGPIAWSFYIVLAVAFGFMLHVRGREKQKFSEACRPILGDKVDGFWGHVIDLIAIFSLIAGTATTFSLATPLLSTAISYVFGFSSGTTLTIIILLLIGIKISFIYTKKENQFMMTKEELEQANAILEMRLYKLIGLEIEALINEHEDTLANIYRYEDILARRDSMAQVIINELDSFKKQYARPRRTVIENAEEAVFEEKKVEEMEVMLLVDRFGYAKTVDMATYERNKEAADNENRYVVQVMNTGKLAVFTDSGKMHLIKVMDVPFGKFRDKGIPIDNYSNFDSAAERVINVFALSDILEEKLLFATKTGMVKVVAGSEFDVAKKTIASTKLADEDEVIGVFKLEKSEFVVLQSKAGYFLKLALSDIPEMKKTAVGNHGIKLGAKDEIETAYVFNKETSPTITYKEKEMVLSNLKVSARNSKGTKR